MAITISLHNKNGNIRNGKNKYDKIPSIMAKTEDRITWLSTQDLYYEEGDYFKVVVDEPNQYLMVRLDESLNEDLIYLEGNEWIYNIPLAENRVKARVDTALEESLTLLCFTLDLALSYILTNEEKYLLKWKELVFSFIKEEGEPNSQNKLCWRPLDAGLRLGFWVRSLVYIGKDKFTSLEWKELLNSIEVHKKYLQESFVNKYLLHPII